MKGLLQKKGNRNFKQTGIFTNKFVYTFFFYICISLMSSEVFAVAPLTLGIFKDATAPQIFTSPISIYTYDGNVGDPMYFRFIPGSSDVYTFQTTGGIDTEGELYASDGSSIEVQDDGGAGDNFLISQPLTAGVTYYFRVTNYTGIDGDPTMLEISGGVLPVELISFTAGMADDKIELEWSTATEINNYGFEVERNTPLPLSRGDNEIVWEKIGFVAGAGNSNSPKEYSFVDVNPGTGKLQYRLKQINTDGSFTYYSQTAEVNYNLTDVTEKQLPTEFALGQNYPNPFNPTTKIQYAVGSGSAGKSKSSEQLVTLKIYDILGNEVAALVNEHKAPGYYEVEFSAGNLSTGVYIYKLTAGSFTAFKKLILMK